MSGREYLYHNHHIDIECDDMGNYCTTIDGDTWLRFCDDEIEAERQAEKYIRDNYDEDT